MKQILSALVLAVALGAATQSQAATYLLTQSDNFGVGSYGTVNVTQYAANELKYVVTLADGYNFTDTGSHEAFAFALKGAPAVTVSAPTGFTLTKSANNVKDAPFDGFDYALDCSSKVCGPSNPGYTGGTNPSTLTFYVSAPTLTDSLVDYATKLYDGRDIYFAADIIKVKNCKSACTGAVGAVAAVPEPATWAMMIIGLFGAGLALRRRERAPAQRALV